MSKTINCIVVDDERIAREIIENYLQKIANYKLVASCKNAVEAFNQINTNQIDLIFLDINMPDISGLSFAKSINKDLKIIFTTAYREFAVDGFDLQAVDYLLKPISFERFLQAINKYNKSRVVIKQSFPNKTENEIANFIFVRSDRKMVKINFSEILYVESLSDYIQIHTKEKVFITRETISNMETKLPTSSFLRVHRSFIISIDQITSFTNEYIEINKKAIPISRSYRKEILQRLESI